MIKKCICVAANARFRKIWSLVQHLFELYAEKCGAELVVRMANNELHIAKYRTIQGITADYDQIALLDCDIVISSKAPNIFDILGRNKLAAWPQKWSTIDREELTASIQKHLYEGYEHDPYFNSGVMVGTSETWARLIPLIYELRDKNTDVLRPKQDQTFLNPAIQMLDIDVLPLSEKWNRQIENHDDGSYFYHAYNCDFDDKVRLIKEII